MPSIQVDQIYGLLPFLAVAYHFKCPVTDTELQSSFESINIKNISIVLTKLARQGQALRAQNKTPGVQPMPRHVC